MRLTPVSPASLIERIKSTLGRQFEDKDIQLEINVEPNLPNVLVDRDRIIHMLTNLVGNALQYTPSGGIGFVQVFKE